MRWLPVLCALLTLGLAFSACGGDRETQSATPTPTPQASSAELQAGLREATRTSAADFPKVKGRTLQEMAKDVLTGPELGLATSVFTPGKNRLAFGVIDPKSGFVYSGSAVYVAPGPDGRARGPYPAPADLLITDPEFRSESAASEDDLFAAIYDAEVPFPGPGNYSILALTRYRDDFIGTSAAVRVVSASQDPVPAVGDRAPRVETDTVFKAGGDIASIDTRVPPDDMHEVGFDEVVGKRPVALLFATPQLCESRVCGPVVDIAAQLKASYGDRMTFVHQEVFVDNDPNKGLREPLKRFNLPTEPWLFVMDKDGRVTARLEGSFGIDAFEQAVKSGL